MSHIPSHSFREAVGLGSVGTLGRADAASPDVSPSGALGLRSRGQINKCLADPFPDHLGTYLNPDDTWFILRHSLVGGQGLQAAQAYRLPTPTGSPTRITQQDFADAAGTLKCELAAIKAVAEVESRGYGFLADGRPKILFEAASFSDLTGHMYDKLYPSISSPVWKRELYLGGAKEYDRLEEAMALNAKAALKSASWGAFQIMGSNHSMVGFGTVEEFVAAMYVSEGAHLKACTAFIQSRKLTKALQEKDWEAFAKGYNGTGYKKNEYDTKLAKAYAKHSAPPAGSKPKPAGQ